MRESWRRCSAQALSRAQPRPSRPRLRFAYRPPASPSASPLASTTEARALSHLPTRLRPRAPRARARLEREPGKDELQSRRRWRWRWPQPAVCITLRRLRTAEVVTCPPRARAALARVLSVVQSLLFDRRADTSRCMSIQPSPLPWSFCSDSKCKTSSWLATVDVGRASSKERISARFFRFPQASSPITNGWQSTEPSSRRLRSSRSPFRKWSTQTDVSTRITTAHALWRRRRTGLSFFSVPPSAASRRALSRAISASRPRRTRAVFSVTPVNCDARLRSSSSMLSVVLICISMYILCIRVKFLLHRD